MDAKRKIIIDCDPGIDDSLALLLALSSEELDIAGITVVSGNVPADIGAENASKILHFAGREDIPVYVGECVPLVRDYVSAQDTHGEDGLGDSDYPLFPSVKVQNNAVQFITDTLSQGEKISIIALGPLTNIAKALQSKPEAFENVEELVSMGGSYKSHGNCSPVAEYNYWCDPDAAKYVYENFQGIIKMVGLDVTRQIVLTPNILEYMKRLDADKAELIEKITRFYFDFHWKYEGIIGCVINDPLAVAYFIDNSLCDGFYSYTTVETQGISIGQSVVDAMDFWKKKHNSLVLTSTDRFRFMEMFISRLFNAQISEIEPVLKQIMNGD